nr:NAD(P)H-hydrate epimerase [Nitrosomonas sp.]
MEKAGLAAAKVAHTRLLTDDKQRILILAGPGNNGGDALVAARHLREWGRQVTLVFTGEAGRLPQDARQALEQWQSAGGTVIPELPGSWISVYCLVIGELPVRIIIRHPPTLCMGCMNRW